MPTLDDLIGNFCEVVTCWWMTAACKEHSPATHVDTSQRCGEKKPGIPMFSMAKR
jgi:hypothetical protein